MDQRVTENSMSEPESADNSLQLHPSLYPSFVALPPAGVALTLAQLHAVFGEDIAALRDLARLAYQSDERWAK